MAEFKEVVRLVNLICKQHKPHCDCCLLSHTNNGTDTHCRLYLLQYADCAEEIIMDWAREHPENTEIEDSEVNKNG